MQIELIIGFITILVLCILTYTSYKDVKKIKEDILNIEREINLMEDIDNE